MAWTHVQGGGTAVYNGTAVTSTSFTLASAVAVGDMIEVASTYGNNTPTNGDVITDQLGNVYSRVEQENDATAGSTTTFWLCIVTVAGTPTITQKFNPTPGTSTEAFVGFAVDHWTGSDSNSASDGGSAVSQAFTAGTDAMTTGSWTPGTSGDLITCAICDGSRGVAVLDTDYVGGTGFTRYSRCTDGSGNTAVAIEAKVQAVAASVAGTWTVTLLTGDTFQIVAMAIKPATGGGGGVAVGPSIGTPPQYWTASVRP